MKLPASDASSSAGPTISSGWAARFIGDAAAIEAITEGLGLVPGIRLLMNQLVPANDGGICVGQAALVAASLPGSQHGKLKTEN